MYEVRTRKGLAYVQHVLTNDFLGDLVRVIPGFFEETPSPEVADEPSRLLLAYPLAAARKQDLVRPVFSAAVPEEYKTFPLMRGSGDWMWDGTRSWQEPRSGPDRRRLPFRAIVTHRALVAYIEAGLANEDLDDEGNPTKPVDYPPAEEAGGGRLHDEPGQHYLYFAQKKKAERAKKVIEGFGFTTTVRESADGEDWLLLVAIKGTIEEEQDLLERIAEGNGGEYDGSEVAVG